MSNILNGLIELAYGCKRHYVNGIVHNDEGSAYIGDDGTQFYFHHGKLHRVGGPARIWSDGSVEYWQHGKRHREDGPAIIHSNGRQWYYHHGLLHREDGPAAIYPDGYVCYFLFDVEVTEEHLAIMGLDDFPPTGFSKDQVMMFFLLCMDE